MAALSGLLKLVANRKPAESLPPEKNFGPAALAHHLQLLEGYLQSHQIRNHSPKTIGGVRSHLSAWFSEYGSGARPLYVWEAMEPMRGRNRIVGYGRLMIEAELENQTIRRYLGNLSGFFSYVLQHPVVFEGETSLRITDLYGPIEQPVSEFDIPQHCYDGDQLGIPLDPERLHNFYGIIREKYLPLAMFPHIRARNYTMAILAGESGFRADELIHLEISKDLFFESKKIQTRFAKGMKGSGKRSRPTLFTPLARDTLTYYLKNHRPHMRGANLTEFLFISRTGKMLTYKSLQKVLKGIVKCSQKNNFPIMDHFTWHWFRRVFATRFIERFPDRLSALINLLGHVTPNTVHSYIRHSEAWTDAQIKETLERIHTNGYSMDP